VGGADVAGERLGDAVVVGQRRQHERVPVAGEAQQVVRQRLRAVGVLLRHAVEGLVEFSVP
jgi:hypothetical protein